MMSKDDIMPQGDVIGEDGNALLTNARRTEINAVIIARLDALLAAHGDGEVTDMICAGVQREGLTQEVALKTLGAVYLIAVAQHVFIRTRRAELREQAKRELQAVLELTPQTQGGKALLRCSTLLGRLIYYGALKKGLL